MRRWYAGVIGTLDDGPIVEEPVVWWRARFAQDVGRMTASQCRMSREVQELLDLTCRASSDQ
jgi:hypothetical protein